MIISVLIMTLTYLLPVSVAIGVAPYVEQNGEKVIHTITEGSYPFLADSLGFGYWLRYALTIGALASNFGTFTAYLNTSASGIFSFNLFYFQFIPYCLLCLALYSLALEGKVPYFLTLTLPHFNTPVVCILFYTMTTCMLVLIDFSVIVEIESVLYCVHVIILFTAFARLRFVAPDMKRPYKLPGNKVGKSTCK